jgi:starch phosphorylase
LTPAQRDLADLRHLQEILENKVCPLYYEQPDQWWRMVLESMNDVVPAFDSDRMAREYYERLYPSV